ncbi:MAG: transposase [Saprospiraceae bacterium]|nr:transposase [Saprospiraceae bacterium]
MTIDECLARNNESVIYSLILKVALKIIKNVGAKSVYTPGMTSILHTFKSDMKYHIHVQALVTLGSLSEKGACIYPKHKHKLAKYRSI